MFREAQEPVEKRRNGLVKLENRLIQIVHYCDLTGVTFFYGEQEAVDERLSVFHSI